MPRAWELILFFHHLLMALGVLAGNLGMVL